MRNLLVVAALIMLNGVAWGQITYPIVGTNQTKFYDNSSEIERPNKGDAFYGQDAHHIGNKPSYTDNGDGTITDNVTGLIWQKEFEVMSYDEAMEAGKKLNLGGKSDWRVPTIKEAYSLILFSGADASSRDMGSVPEGAIPFIDTNYFSFGYGTNGTRAIDTQLLSSTIYVGSSSRQQMIFGVNIADGRIKSYPMNTREGGKKYTVRFVRGAEYGVNKFVENKKTITDTATGLMWQKEDSGKGLNWEEALEYAQQMNKKKYLGYDDWRVPDAKELQSIVDYTRSPETTESAAIDPIFKISKIKDESGEKDFPFFWSSTTHCATGIRTGEGAAASYVSFGRGLGNMKQTQNNNQRQGARGGDNRGSYGGGNSNNANNNSYRFSGVGHDNISSQVGSANESNYGNSSNNNGNYGSNNYRNSNSMQGSQGFQGSQEYSNANNNSKSTDNWINIHGAGCQRSDPKAGDAKDYTGGRGPQGDAIRIYNYVRLVRDLK